MENNDTPSPKPTEKTPSTSRNTKFWSVAKDGPGGLEVMSDGPFDRREAEATAKALAEKDGGVPYFAVRVGAGFCSKTVTETKVVKVG